MYFGNSNCILEYDGTEWRRIYMPNYSTVRSLAIDNKNILYAGAYNELGFLVPDKIGNLKYHSLTHLIDPVYQEFGDVWNIQCIDNEIYFLTENYLFRYKDQKFDYWLKSNRRFYLSYKVDNELYIQDMGKGLMKLEDDSLVLIKNGSFFSNKRIHSILPFHDKKIICTRTQGLFLLDPESKTHQITPFSELSVEAKNLNNFFLENIYYCGIPLDDDLFAMGSIMGGVLVVNKDFEVVDVINEESTGIVSSAQDLFYDEGKALWIAMANGISRVDILSPYRYWNNDKGINGSISDVATIDSTIYISTGSGVYYTSTKADNKNYSINTFKAVEGRFEQTWGFLYFILPDTDFMEIRKKLHDPDHYYHPHSDEMLLLVASSNGLYQIKDGESIFISNHKPIFDIYQYKKDPSKIYLALANGIALLSYENGQWVDYGMQFKIDHKIGQLDEDSIGNLWASASYKGIYRIQKPLSKNSKVQLFNEENGLPNVQAIQFIHYQDTLLFLSLNNYYSIQHPTDSFKVYTVQEQIPEDTLETLVDSLSWYQQIGNITSNLYVSTYADSSEWFGTTDAIFRYLLTKEKDYGIDPAIIRKVTLEDSVIFNGTNYLNVEGSSDTILNKLLNPSSVVDIETVLEFNDNSLSFHYSVPYFEEEDKNTYSYYLEGYEKDWGEWTSKTTKDYSNLPEGEYIFKVKGKNLYQLESKPAEFKFTILPPWYRRFGAILAYIVIGIILIVVIVRLYTIRLIRDKEKLEKIVIERTQEILMQKEEILVQAEHLKDANERISGKNEELEKQKWEITNQALKLKKANIELKKLSKVASETDNAIAIFDKDMNMEWVNEGYTRMYGYTFEQYKEEKNINLIEGSENPYIRKALKICVEEKKSVVYEFNTETRNGKEIWAQTTLTHIFDKDGETTNIIAIDSDITEIKKAEKEIAEQRDKLAISNATKNKFFSIIAHDLRNPISTLAGSTNVILNDFDEYNKGQTKHFIAELNKLSQTTYNLLENLLDWSSSQMGESKFDPKKVNLSLLTIENIELIKRKIDSKSIELKNAVTKDCIAFADENMIKTIIRNLLSNAVKFTPDHGNIELSCIVEGDYIKYSIKDSGIGISDENQKKLFRIDKHYTTPGLSNEKGSGLGLILCKEFVEKNGGTIEIVSKPNKGTHISFTVKKDPF